MVDEESIEVNIYKSAWPGHECDMAVQIRPRAGIITISTVVLQ
jgi:hypothetical protein